MREPGYEAKALLEAIREVVEHLRWGNPVDFQVADSLEMVADKFQGKVHAKEDA